MQFLDGWPLLLKNWHIIIQGMVLLFLLPSILQEKKFVIDFKVTYIVYILKSLYFIMTAIVLLI